MGKRHSAGSGHSRESSVILGVTVGIICGFFLGSWSRTFLASCSKTGWPGDCCGFGDAARVGDQSFYQVDLLNMKDNNIPGMQKKQSDIVPTYKTALVTNITGHKQLVLIGVMTAKKYLNSRALAAYETWGKTIPGDIIFFSSAGSQEISPPSLPVIGLAGVDDSYPPQKKSFLMIKYMYEHFSDKYEWFIRADDDVYMKADKLGAFLHSVNSSGLKFIGQTGLGNKDEIGMLNLNADENFCMGGPGIVFSGATLKKMVPHISFCLKNLYSTHEDVEVGRCVRKFAGIPCTWAFEVSCLFAALILVLM